MFQYPQAGRMRWSLLLHHCVVKRLEVSVPSSGSYAMEHQFLITLTPATKGFSTLKRVVCDGASRIPRIQKTFESEFQYPQAGRMRWSDKRVVLSREQFFSFSTLKRVVCDGAFILAKTKSDRSMFQYPQAGRMRWSPAAPKSLPLVWRPGTIM